MITEVNESILNLPEYSVLLHQCNTKGWLGTTLSKTLAKRWPNSFNEYHEYCCWFRDGHEDEILGTFVGVRVKPT